MEIEINGRPYAGAPYPAFNKLMINESEFSHEERCKYAMVEFNPEGRSTIEWLCQEEDYHSANWYDEIKRAFIANGAKSGHIIDVKFGSRDIGYCEEFEIEVK